MGALCNCNERRVTETKSYFRNASLCDNASATVDMCAGVFSWGWWENQGVCVDCEFGGQSLYFSGQSGRFSGHFLLFCGQSLKFSRQNQRFCRYFIINGTIGPFVLNMNLIVKVKLYINNPSLHSNKKTAQKVHSF